MPRAWVIEISWNQKIHVYTFCQYVSFLIEKHSSFPFRTLFCAQISKLYRMLLFKFTGGISRPRCYPELACSVQCLSIWGHIYLPSNSSIIMYPFKGSFLNSLCNGFLFLFYFFLLNQRASIFMLGVGRCKI